MLYDRPMRTPSTFSFFIITGLMSCSVITGEEGGSNFECGTQLCPGGMRPISVESEDACIASCEPFAECPSWSTPVITENCFACGIIEADGNSFNITQPLGRADRYDSCEAMPAEDATISVLKYRIEVDISDPENLSGDAFLDWSDADDKVICTAVFSLKPSSGTPPSADEGVDVTFGLSHVFTSGLREEGCRALDIDLLSKQVELLDNSYFYFGYSENWSNWEGKSFSDVIFRYDKNDGYTGGDWYPYQQGSIWQNKLQMDAILGVSYGDYLDSYIPVSGYETWKWVSDGELCEEQMFVIGATPIDVQTSFALYDVTFARGTGSTGCTSGIWREARGQRSGYLTTLNDEGDVINWTTAEVSDASTSVPRWEVEWDAVWGDSTSAGTLFMEHL